MAEILCFLHNEQVATELWTELRFNIGAYFYKEANKGELIYLLKVVKLNTFYNLRLQVLLYFMNYIFNKTLWCTNDLILKFIYLSRIATWEWIIVLLIYYFINLSLAMQVNAQFIS